MARGSIFGRHGGYARRVDLGPDPATGKRRQFYQQGFTTKKAAEAGADAARHGALRRRAVRDR